jgi:hypothetical protein
MQFFVSFTLSCRFLNAAFNRIACEQTGLTLVALVVCQASANLLPLQLGPAPLPLGVPALTLTKVGGPLLASPGLPIATHGQPLLAGHGLPIATYGKPLLAAPGLVAPLPIAKIGSPILTGPLIGAPLPLGKVW